MSISLSRWGIPALVLASYLNFFVALDLGPANLRPSMIVLLALAGPWLLLVSRRGRMRVPGFWSVLALVITFWGATLLNYDSPYIQRGVISCLLLALNVMHYILVTDGLGHASLGRLDHVVSILIGGGVIYGLSALAGVVLTLLGIPNNLVAVMWLQAYQGAPYEGPMPLNGFGTVTASYLASVLVMLLGRLLYRGRARWYEWLGVGVLGLDVLNSYSRGAWLGTIVGGGVLIVTLLSQRTKRLGRLLAVGFIVGLLSVMLWWVLQVVTPTVTTILQARFGRFFDLDDGTVSDRRRLWLLPWEDLWSSPLIGHGADAYQAFITRPGEVVESLLFEVLHSSGFLGVAFLFMPILTQAIRAVHALRRVQHPSVPIELLVMTTGGFATLLAATQTNPAWQGAFYWIVLALWATSVGQICRSRAGDAEVGSLPDVLTREVAE